MSIAILGGLDRLKGQYENVGKQLGFQVKFFGQRVPDMKKRLSKVHGIVLFTNTISHHMVNEAVLAAKKSKIKINRTHTSSISSLKKCLGTFAAS